MTKSNEVYNLGIQLRERFVNLIISLNVAAVGFAIYNTYNESLNFKHIPLGLAIIGWAISIFSGIRYLETMHEVLKHNLKVLQIEEGSFPNIKQMTPQAVSDLHTKTSQEMIKASNGAGQSYNKLLKFFYFGGVLYIVYHVVSMTLRII